MKGKLCTYNRMCIVFTCITNKTTLITPLWKWLGIQLQVLISTNKTGQEDRESQINDTGILEQCVQTAGWLLQNKFVFYGVLYRCVSR